MEATHQAQGLGRASVHSGFVKQGCVIIYWRGASTGTALSRIKHAATQSLGEAVMPVERTGAKAWSTGRKDAGTKKADTVASFLCNKHYETKHLSSWQESLDKAQRPGHVSLFAAIVNLVATFSLQASVLTYFSVFRETPSSLEPFSKFLNRIPLWKRCVVPLIWKGHTQKGKETL